MRRFLPIFSVRETTICFDDGEAEGWEIGIEWLGLIVELTIARKTWHLD